MMIFDNNSTAKDKYLLEYKKAFYTRSLEAEREHGDVRGTAEMKGNWSKNIFKEALNILSFILFLDVLSYFIANHRFFVLLQLSIYFVVSANKRVSKATSNRGSSGQQTMKGFNFDTLLYFD